MSCEPDAYRGELVFSFCYFEEDTCGTPCVAKHSFTLPLAGQSVCGLCTALKS